MPRSGAHGTAAATVVGIALVAAAVVGGCSAGGSDAGPSSQPVTTSEPAKAFAPLVRFHPRESAWPMSADRFLDNASLEWGGGPCPLEVNISSGRVARPVAGEPVPLLEPRRLGREPAYRLRPRREGCATGDLRPHAFTTTQRTRPFDLADRPPGLYMDEGFNLDLLTDALDGERRLGEDGTLTGVPAYTATERTTVDGRPGVRLSYWLLFGRGKARNGPGQPLLEHEGDWERIDVLVQVRGGRTHVPVAVRYHRPDGIRTVAWADAERGGPDGAHPVVHLAPETHVPSPTPVGARAEGGVEWRSWRQLRDVRREPWYGYGGAWGAIGRSDANTGPLGPSPFEIDAPPVSGSGFLADG